MAACYGHDLWEDVSLCGCHLTKKQQRKPNSTLGIACLPILVSSYCETVLVRPVSRGGHKTWRVSVPVPLFPSVPFGRFLAGRAADWISDAHKSHGHRGGQQSAAIPTVPLQTPLFCPDTINGTSSEGERTLPRPRRDTQLWRKQNDVYNLGETGLKTTLLSWELFFYSCIWKLWAHVGTW